MTWKNPARKRSLSFRGCLGLVAILLACERAPVGDTILAKQADELRPQTVPPDATAYTRTSPSRSASSVTIYWEFETAWDQNRYTRWVTGQLQPKFEVKSGDKLHLVFVSYFQGESESLVIEMAPKAGNLHVRVAVFIRPG